MRVQPEKRDKIYFMRLIYKMLYDGPTTIKIHNYSFQMESLKFVENHKPS